MSIIYNALQKAQQNRQKESKKNVRVIAWPHPILISSAIVLISVGTYSMANLIEHANHAHSTAATLAAVAPAVVATTPPPVAVTTTEPVMAKLPAPTASIAETTLTTKQPTSNVNLVNYKSSHVLSGVYLSDDEKIALINNKFFHLGDTIDGMKLVSIESNRIVLRYADNALILQTDQT